MHFLLLARQVRFFDPLQTPTWGIDGEIEFKDHDGNASGFRVYLQLKSGDSYLYQCKDGQEIFTIKNHRHVKYWVNQPCPVMLVIRTSDGVARWMNVTRYLRSQKREKKPIKSIVFDGEAFTAHNVLHMRDERIEARVEEVNVPAQAHPTNE